MTEKIPHQLAKAQVAFQYKPIIPGTPVTEDYHRMLKKIRYFYEHDAIAGTVINRMTDMAITVLRNKKVGKRNATPLTEEVEHFYRSVADSLVPFLRSAALEYLLSGCLVPTFTTKKIRGNVFHESLGRTRYTVIDKIWVRNPDNLLLRKTPFGDTRSVYLKIPEDDITFIKNKGKRGDGTADLAAYNQLVETYPDYVTAIQNGQVLFLLPDTLYARKLTSYNVYPIPFLKNALNALEHKAHLKKMDQTLASRAIEAIRLIKTGDKDFPALDDDITAIRSLVEQNQSTGELVYNLFTGHTTTIEWAIPPLDALLSEVKYIEPNADIFLAIGFPRILVVGETSRSGSSDSKIALIGPKSTLEDLRLQLLAFVDSVYKYLAELNGFTQVPEPYFSPIATSDYTALTQFAVDAMTNGAISKDTVAQLYGSDYTTEVAQREIEKTVEDVLFPQPVAVQPNAAKPVSKPPTATKKPNGG